MRKLRGNDWMRKSSQHNSPSSLDKKHFQLRYMTLIQRERINSRLINNSRKISPKNPSKTTKFLTTIGVLLWGWGWLKFGPDEVRDGPNFHQPQLHTPIPWNISRVLDCDRSFGIPCFGCMINTFKRLVYCAAPFHIKDFGYCLSL